MTATHESLERVRWAYDTTNRSGIARCVYAKFRQFLLKFANRVKLSQYGNDDENLATTRVASNTVRPVWPQ